MNCKKALVEMGRWRESMDQLLDLVESIKRNIEHNGWDERMHNLLDHIDQLDRDATMEMIVLKEIQGYESDKVINISRDHFKRRTEEISWEQPNKRGEAADRIDALRKDEKANISITVEVDKIYYSRKDPYTKQDIKDPVQNKICKHVYDRESVLTNIDECKKRRLLCECPVAGCPNKKPLRMSDMIAFPRFYDYLKD